MNIFKYVAMISVAAILASTPSRSATDGTSDGIQKIDQLWMVVYVDDAGREIVPQAKLTTGNYAPLMAVDEASDDEHGGNEVGPTYFASANCRTCVCTAPVG